MKIISENLLEKTILTKEEISMAKNYYYKGMEWVPALQNSELGSQIKDNYSKEYIERVCSCYKKRIVRAMQKYSKF